MEKWLEGLSLYLDHKKEKDSMYTSVPPATEEYWAKDEFDDDADERADRDGIGSASDFGNS